MRNPPNRFIALLVTFALLFSFTGNAQASEPASASGHVEPITQSLAGDDQSTVTTRSAAVPTYQEAYERMVALKEAYPEGMTWTNFEPYGTKGNLGADYRWHGGPILGNVTRGVGCAAFAFILSDAAFGDLPARVVYDFSFEDVKVGDILRINGDSHSVIVIAKSSGGVVLAEANYNKSVHWGRTLSKAAVEAANFIVTRYPANYVPADDPDADTEISHGEAGSLSWTLTKSGILHIFGNGAIPNFSPNDNLLPPWSAYNDAITTIIIDAGVASVGEYAFSGSKALEVYLSSSVSDIGASAFRASSLVAVTIPGTVTNIGNEAFYGCTNLASVTISEGVKVIGDNAFRGCTSLQYIDFPASITRLGDGAFMSCSEMRSARFAASNGDAAIGDNLFSQCWKLMSVILPRNADCISAGMFSHCTSLMVLYIPASVKQIGAEYGTIGKESPFTSCPYLSVINFGGTEDEWQAMTAGNRELAAVLEKVTINYEVPYEDPFAKDPNDPGDLVTDPVEPSKHEHAWATAWTHDEAHHWHECEADDCPVSVDADKDGYAPHTYVEGVCICGVQESVAPPQHDCTTDGHEYVDNICKWCGAEKPVTPAEHEHAWSTDWASDSTHHWHECEAPDCPITSNSEKDGYAPHVYSVETPDPDDSRPDPDLNDPVPSNTVCLVCGYDSAATPPQPTHQHDWSAVWASNSTHHWHECEADDCLVTEDSEKDGYALHEYVKGVCVCGAKEPIAPPQHDCASDGHEYLNGACKWCGVKKPVTPPQPAHTHAWSTTWSSNVDYHWHACQASGCSLTDPSQQANYGAHTYGGWIVDYNATIYREGLMHRDCTVCAYRQTSTIPAIPYPNYPDYGDATYPNGNTGNSNTSNGSGTNKPSGNSSNNSNATPSDSTPNPDKPVIAVTTSPAGQIEADVSLPATTVSSAAQSGRPIALDLPAIAAGQSLATAPVITVRTGSNTPVKVSIPITSATPGTVAVIVRSDGSTSQVKTSVATSNGLIVSVANDVTLKIVDNSKTFADVPANAWSAKAVAFVSARELFSGVSETDFAPNTPMTRAMFITVLARLNDVETTGGSTWYTKALEWAKVTGISDGINPDGNITREQLVTMLWRYQGSPAATGTLASFTDADGTSSYAEPAMRWAVANGIVSGFGDGRLGPQEQTTRAQVAQIFQNLIENSSF